MEFWLNGGGQPQDHEGQGEDCCGGERVEDSGTFVGLPGLVIIELGPQ